MKPSRGNVKKQKFTILTRKGQTYSIKITKNPASSTHICDKWMAVKGLKPIKLCPKIGFITILSH